MIQIEYLAEHASLIPVLAEWHFGQWGYLNPANDVERRISEFLEHGHQQIPTTFVALDEAKPIGSASLIVEDMDTRKELTPWLASVFVDPAYRNKGIGSSVVQRVVEEARLLGVEKLYLFTPDRESFYGRMGWSVFERTEFHGERVVIMTIQPTALA